MCGKVRRPLLRGASCFDGGRYDLYTYKVYSDLRLVFAPESDLAQFGRAARRRHLFALRS